MKTLEYNPKPAETFNAVQRIQKTLDGVSLPEIPDKNNPQLCISSCKWYVTAEDNDGNARIFKHERWRFEKAK